MKKLLPVAIVFLVISAVASALMQSPIQASSTDTPLTQAQFVKIAEGYHSSFINIVQRLEALEKKTGVKPPKDSLKIEKKK